MNVFCEGCNDFVESVEKVINKNKVIKGKDIVYQGKEAYCDECGNTVHSAAIRDYNLEELDKAYRISENLVTPGIVLRIIEIYNISRRPLSLLLGWGEQTISRYLAGDTPSKEYSDVLMKISKDANYYSERLEAGKDNITEVAYRKSKNALSALKNKESSKSKIENVILYLLYKSEDITPLALQKLLYYSQSFNRVFNKKFLFSNDCEAWVHGPVYRSVYEQYRNYSFNSIETHDDIDSIQLEDYEKELLDSIIINFGCYSGRILEKMTHTELPWIQSRKDLLSNESCDRIIEKDIIKDYFDKISMKYNMLTVVDIKDYSSDLFNKVN